MNTITERNVKSLASPNSPTEPDIDRAIRRRLQGCTYGFVFDKISWHCHDGTLTLCGRVPSFHLKQMLQELLRNIEGVRSLENSVDVVNSTGLSSDGPNTPR